MELATAKPLDLIRESQLDRVAADVIRPRCNQLGETAAVVCKERPRGFFESRQITRDGGHESIRGFLRRTDPVVISPRAARFFHQLAQGDRSAARLEVQPVPMTGQERDLFRHDTESRASAPAALDGLIFRDLSRFSSDLTEVDLPARCVVENQHLALRSIPQERGNVLGGAGRYLSKTFERRVPHALNIPG